jgi:hypothetical protein
MRRELGVGMVLAVSAAVAWAGPYSVGVGRCPGLLGSNVYSCAVKAEDGTSFTDCLRFATPGVVSPKFEFVSDQLGSTVGCTCDPVGNPGAPAFGAAPSFTCTAAEGVTFTGKVLKDGTIARGAAANVRGGSWAFSCQRNPACTIGP